MFILAERLDCIACTMVDVSELIKLQRKSRIEKKEKGRERCSVHKERSQKLMVLRIADRKQLRIFYFKSLCQVIIHEM